MRCRDCGRFMNCEDPDAHHGFTPDNHFGPERNEWVCGWCIRGQRAAGAYAVGIGEDRGE